MVFKTIGSLKNIGAGMLKIPLLVVALCAFYNSAHAIPINAIDVSGATTLSPTTSDTVIGWLFRAEDDIDVISLGMWDFQENGFTLGSVEVGLWDVGGTLLASTTVLSTDSLSNGFRFSGITAVSLSAGMEYVVGGLSIAPEAYQFNAAVSNSPNVTWLESRATNSSTLVLPTGFIGTPGAFFGANFQYAEETVPAPATLALFGLGLMGLGWSRRRKI